LVWGPAEHDTCPASDYYINVQAWFWRGELELGTWLARHGREPHFSKRLLDDAAVFKVQLETAVNATLTKLPNGKTFLSPILCEPGKPRPYVPAANEREPWRKSCEAFGLAGFSSRF
jgi:hypothetical protein